jgi:hypothetical protein
MNKNEVEREVYMVMITELLCAYAQYGTFQKKQRSNHRLGEIK